MPEREERVPTSRILAYSAPLLAVFTSNALVGLYLLKFSTDVLLPAGGIFLLACGSAALNQVQEAAIRAAGGTDPDPNNIMWGLYCDTDSKDITDAFKTTDFFTRV